MTITRNIATITAIVVVCGTVLSVGRHTSNRTLAVDAPALDMDSVFAKPRIQEMVDRLRSDVVELFRQQRYDQALQKCSTLVELAPEDPTSHYNLGCALAQLSDPDAAMESLTAAVRFGFRSPKLLQDDADLRSLHQREDWKQLLTAAATPFEPSAPGVRVTPATISRGVAMVDEANSVWNPRTRLIHTFFRYDPAQTADQPVAAGNSEVSRLLRQWQDEGTAAGHLGVLYDNRDRGHSSLKGRSFPQLTRIVYSDKAKQFNLDNGSQQSMFFNGIVFGNSSTALVGNAWWRSQPRLMYGSGRTAGALAAQYFGNHIYMYPEHRDYDPGTNGRSGFGDVYPANTPYVIISQGSSGSDRVFMQAVAATLAAFRTDTRRLLSQKAALMPCVQMIFRMSNTQVRTPDNYLSGIAHPPVFQGRQLNKVKMVKMAHEMRPDDVPPVALVEVVNEDSFQVGRDYFEMGPRESLFTTPAAVARVCRAVSQSRQMTVSAEKSFDLNQKPLTWHWAVLQGDPQLINIEPQNDEQSVARITVQHHERQPIRPDSSVQSSRVDIGLFVHNGTWWSAPAIISFYWPENEVRSYSDDGRILSVEYRTMDQGGLYTDPALVTGRNWRDEYLYDDDNRLTGWERVRGNDRQAFSRHGYLVTETDELSRPLKAVSVRYYAEVTGKRKGSAVLKQRRGTSVYTFRYRSESDRLGSVTKAAATEDDH